MVGGQNPGPEALLRRKKDQEKREQRICQGRSDVEGIFSAHRAREDGARVEMNVTAHQEKQKNEETKKGKGRAGEKRKKKQAIDFKAVCCPSAVV